MSYPINYPTPQNANVQIFYKDDNNTSYKSWVKPQGASFVWFTLIGAGGGGGGAGIGGNSGNVTNFMCPAFLIPDVLRVRVGEGGDSATGGGSTELEYQEKGSSGYVLLRANGGVVSGSANTANAANYFTAMGFYQSVLGQVGSNGAASTTTFLAGGDTGPGYGNYGYTQPDSDGYFLMRPIIVGVGAAGTGAGGIGGGGGSNNGKGGNGLAVIITW